MKKYLYYIIMLLFILSCDNETSEDLTNNENIETDEKQKKESAIIVDDSTFQDIGSPFILNLLDLSNKKQEWYNLEAETYCKSYSLPYLRPKYSNYPDGLYHNKIFFLGRTGERETVDVSRLTKEYDNGIILYKPDSVALYYEFDSTHDGFNSSLAEKYFRFTYKEDSIISNLFNKNKDYAMAYDAAMKNIRKRFDFIDMKQFLHKRRINYKTESGISNEELIVVYSSFVYFLENEMYDMIAHTLVSYPLPVKYDGNRKFISNPAEFMKDTSKIFTDELKEDIKETRFYKLYPWDGKIMMANKRVILGRKLGKVKIIEINNKNINQKL